MKALSKQQRTRLKRPLEHNQDVFGNMPEGKPTKISEPAELLANLLWLIWSGRPSAVVSTQKEMRQQAQLYLSTYFGNIPNSLLSDAIKRIPLLFELKLREMFIGTMIKEAIRAELGGLTWKTALQRAQRKIESNLGLNGIHPAVLEKAKQTRL